MARQDDIKDRDNRIVKFIRAVTETAARMNTENLTLIAIGFVYGLLWEYLSKAGQAAAVEKSELAAARDKWMWQEGDK